MMDYCGKESTINDMPMYSGEEVRNPRREQNVAVYAENTAAALKEANMLLDKLVNNLFGPRADKVQEPPTPPVGCFEQQMMQNAEVARITANRIGELMSRMFG